MSYSLEVRINGSELRKIDLSRFLQFDEKSTEVSSTGWYSLSTIDRFTTQFDDQNKLIEFLVAEGVLEATPNNYSLVIISNNKDDNFALDVLYNNSILFFDPKLLFIILYSQYTILNYDFIMGITMIAKEKDNGLGEIASLLHNAASTKNKVILNNLIRQLKQDNDDILSVFIKQLTEDDENYPELHIIISKIIRLVIRLQEDNVLKRLIETGKDNLISPQSLEGWYYMPQKYYLAFYDTNTKTSYPIKLSMSSKFGDVMLEYDITPKENDKDDKNNSTKVDSTGEAYPLNVINSFTSQFDDLLILKHHLVHCGCFDEYISDDVVRVDKRATAVGIVMSERMTLVMLDSEMNLSNNMLVFGISRHEKLQPGESWEPVSSPLQKMKSRDSSTEKHQPREQGDESDS